MTLQKQRRKPSRAFWSNGVPKRGSLTARGVWVLHVPVLSRGASSRSTSLQSRCPPARVCIGLKQQVQGSSLLCRAWLPPTLHRQRLLHVEFWDDRVWGPRRVGAPKGGAQKGAKGGPKISLFFFPSSPPQQFSFFFPSLRVFWWNFGGVFEGWDLEMCTFGVLRFHTTARAKLVSTGTLHGPIVPWIPGAHQCTRSRRSPSMTALANGGVRC